MQQINRYIRALFSAAAIAAPFLVVAEAKAQEASVQVRVYDQDHRDYHNWNDHEEHAYRSYLTAQHRGYREYQGNTTECRGITGIGATVIRTAINEGRFESGVSLTILVRGRDGPFSL